MSPDKNGKVPPASDGQLVLAARIGDPEAFETLVRRHYGAARGVALAVLGNVTDAEDVCQDAFLRALERLDDCREPEKFMAWLLQIVRNRARNFRSYRRVRQTVQLDLVTARSSDDPQRDAQRMELRQLLDGALRELSGKQREVVMLHDLEGWTHQAIAEHLGMSEVMSRQHLFVARKHLRRALGAHALEDYGHE